MLAARRSLVMEPVHMSASPVLDAFPRRPISLAATPGRKRGRIIGLVICLLLFGPSVYWGVINWREAGLRADLRARGVMAAETRDNGGGTCTVRRARLSGNETPQGCDFTITYTLRSEEGGGERQAAVHIEGREPIFTPTAYYDPQDPSRVMLKPEIDRDPGFSEQWNWAILLLLPFAALLWWWLSGRRGLAKAAAAPDPVIAPIEQAIRQMPANRLVLTFRPPGAPRQSVTTLGPGEEPLLVRPPAGAPEGEQWLLALRTPGGRAYALDARLRDLALSDEERTAIQNAAWA
jgi:hypothetical protein